MKKRLVALLTGTLIAVSVLSGCGGSSQSSSTADPAPAQEEESSAPEAESEPEAEAEPAAEEEGTSTEETAGGNYTIAVMVKDSSTPFWRYLVSGAQEAADELGVTVVEYAPMEAQSLDEQTKQVEDAIQAGVDAICIAPVDSDGIVPALEKANEAGIPVIAINTKANGAKIETFVGIDNEAAAENLAQYMVDELGNEGKVVIIEGNPAGQTSVDRVAGFTTILEKYEGIELTVSQPGYFKRDEAMTIMENLIQANPDIDAVLALNDEMALGAWQALDDAGMTDDVVISGFDGAVEGCNAILGGKLKASMDQDAIGTGYEGVKAAVEVLNGNTVDEWIKIGGTVVNGDNAQDYLDNFAAHGFSE